MSLYYRLTGVLIVRCSYQIDEEGAGRAKATFSPAEEEKFHEMARDPDLYEKLSSSIAPSIYGDYTTNIKKAIACLLVGGSRKRLPDGMIVSGHFLPNKKKMGGCNVFILKVLTL